MPTILLAGVQRLLRSPYVGGDEEVCQVFNKQPSWTFNDNCTVEAQAALYTHVARDLLGIRLQASLGCVRQLNYPEKSIHADLLRPQ